MQQRTKILPWRIHRWEVAHYKASISFSCKFTWYLTTWIQHPPKEVRHHKKITHIQVWSGFLYKMKPRNTWVGLKKERTWQCFSTGIIIIIVTPTDLLQKKCATSYSKNNWGIIFCHFLPLWFAVEAVVSLIQSIRANTEQPLWKTSWRCHQLKGHSWVSFTLMQHALSWFWRWTK